MSTKLATQSQTIQVRGIQVEVIRKDIKNLHLGVYPPLGRVRVAVPLVVSDDAVRLAVIDKLGWIRRQRAKFIAQPRQSEREMINGESHYVLGRRYRLRVIEQSGLPRVALRGIATLAIFVRPGSTTLQRQATLVRWHREQLKALVPPLLEKWQAVLGVKATTWGVKKMKTKWGTCNAMAGRIWLNLELFKKPAPCIEYILVHELMHLIDRTHSERFIALMDLHLPDWRNRKALLNHAPLGHDQWDH